MSSFLQKDSNCFANVFHRWALGSIVNLLHNLCTSNYIIKNGVYITEMFEIVFILCQMKFELSNFDIHFILFYAFYKCNISMKMIFFHCILGYDGYKHDGTSNLTSEKKLIQSLFHMKASQFTAGTLLGLLVASMVVVIGSFLVLWRLCCDVEMVVTREVMEPLNSISQTVAKSPKKSSIKKKSTERLISHGCSSSVLEITETE